MTDAEQQITEALEAADETNYTYVGKVNPKYKGQPCKLICTWRGKGKHNVSVEFEDGYRMVVPMRGNVIKRKEANNGMEPNTRSSSSAGLC